MAERLKNHKATRFDSFPQILSTFYNNSSLSEKQLEIVPHTRIRNT